MELRKAITRSPAGAHHCQQLCQLAAPGIDVSSQEVGVPLHETGVASNLRTRLGAGVEPTVVDQIRRQTQRDDFRQEENARHVRGRFNSHTHFAITRMVTGARLPPSPVECPRLPNKGDGGPRCAARPWIYRMQIEALPARAARLSIPAGRLTDTLPGTARFAPRDTPH